MELAEYLNSIWRRKWIVLAVMAAIIAADVAVMTLLPRHYVATSLLQSGGVKSYLQPPGVAAARDMRNTLPSAVQPITETYLKLLTSPTVLDEAKDRVKTQLAQSGSLDAGSAAGSAKKLDYTVTGRGEFVLNSDADIIYIDVTSDDPLVAKSAADALANVLFEKSHNMDTDMAHQFTDDLQKNQVDPLSLRLDQIRTETEKLKAAPNGDAAATADKTVKLANLADEAKNLEDVRKQYTDLIARVNVNLALNTTNLNILSAAVMPAEKEKPAIFKSGLIASIIGLFAGAIAVATIDRRKTDQPATIF